MKPETLKRCIAEAKRFIKLAEEVPVDRSCFTADDWSVKHGDKKVGDRREPYIETGKASGAAKRASMDLSRELANLRCNR
jgi:hypothetical protein